MGRLLKEVVNMTKTKKTQTVVTQTKPPTNQVNRGLVDNNKIEAMKESVATKRGGGGL